MARVLNPINPADQGQGGGTDQYSLPVAATPSSQVSSNPRPYTMSEQGRPLPIVYGLVKIPVTLIEKFSSTPLQPNAWAPSQLFAAWRVGTRVQNGGNVYELILPGTTASSGGPSGTGSSILDGTCTWNYVQQMPMPNYFQKFLAALCEGPADGGWKVWWDKETFANLAVKTTFDGKPGLYLYTGVDAATQALPPDYDVSGYQHTVLLGAGGATSTVTGLVASGTQEELPDIAVLVQALLFGSSSSDPSPADVLNDLLTHARRGCAWPSSRVDTSITGTATSGFRTYCDAAGFRFSMVIDTEQPALNIIAAILSATNSDAVWSGGKLKVVPLGDQAIASPVYGSTGYVPANTAQYNLTADDFLDIAEPVKMTRRPDGDCFNCWPIEYTDRGMGYVKTTVEDPDQVDVELRGFLKKQKTTALPIVYPDGTYAVALSRILAQRSLYSRNTYSFRLSWKYLLLEPTDIVTLTDAVLGLVAVPVRITSIAESGDGFQLTAEDFPVGVQASPGYTPDVGTGYQPNEKATAAKIPTLVDGTTVGLQNLVVQTPHIAAGNADASKLTLTNFGNLWPNGDSEAAVPAGADLTSPEWNGLVNLGGGAYAGAWVREVIGANVKIEINIPCLPGESYYIEAYCKAKVAGANKGGYLELRGQVSPISGTIVDSVENDTTTWTKLSCTVTTPAGALLLRARLYAGSDAAADAYFDAIKLVRMIDPVTIDGLSGNVIPQPAWIAPTLLGTWVNFGGTNPTAAYYKDSTGVVWLKGLVKSGVLGTAAFNLPAGYRPTSQGNIVFPANSNGAFGRIDIAGVGGTFNVGDVVLGFGGVGSNVFYSLNGISFRAEN